MSITETEVDDFLEHFGVKGMKWGVRKSKSVTGMSRRRAALIDTNNRRIQLHTNIRDRKAGVVLNTLSALDKILMGKARFEKFHTLRINALSEQNARVKSGKVLVRDRLASNLGVAPIDMLIERRPA